MGRQLSQNSTRAWTYKNPAKKRRGSKVGFNSADRLLRYSTSADLPRPIFIKPEQHCEDGPNGLKYLKTGVRMQRTHSSGACRGAEVMSA